MMRVTQMNEFRASHASACLLACLLAVPAAAAAELRPRLAVLTDIGGDPDDQQSMIRLLVYANEFEIEALIATASGTPGELKEAVTQPNLIREIIGGYERALPNLGRHATGWPEVEQLLRRVKSGNPQRGRKAIGEGHDTAGSRFLIERIDAGSAERPLNLPPGGWRIRWYDPRTGHWHDNLERQEVSGGDAQGFESPFVGDAVLLLQLP